MIILAAVWRLEDAVLRINDRNDDQGRMFTKLPTHKETGLDIPAVALRLEAPPTKTEARK